MKSSQCPECKEKDKIVFCGLKPNGKGNYENSWECVNCGYKWTTEINRNTINEFRT